METDKTYLAHHGIKGQKWGIRRYQNADGSLTELGKKRYGNVHFRDKAAMTRRIKRDVNTKRLLTAGATVAAAALGAYALYKYSDFAKERALNDINSMGKEYIDKLDSDDTLLSKKISEVNSQIIKMEEDWLTERLRKAYESDYDMSLDDLNTMVDEGFNGTHEIRKAEEYRDLLKELREQNLQEYQEIKDRKYDYRAKVYNSKGFGTANRVHKYVKEHGEGVTIPDEVFEKKVGHTGPKKSEDDIPGVKRHKKG